MSEFIIEENNFSLKLLERVPEPAEGECFLLYQTGSGIQNSMIISNSGKYSSATVRHGRYDKKVVLSLKRTYFNKKYRVVMVNADFYFNVNVSISYELQDVQKYYFQGKMEEGDIQQAVKESIKIQNKKWNISQGWELQDALDAQIENKLKKYEGIKFKIIIEVVPDEAALEMQESNRDKTVGIHTSGNMAEKQIAMNAHKKKVVESEQELKLQKIQELAFMVKNFGDLGPIVDGYAQDKISNEELYNYIIKAKTNDINMLNMAMSNEMLTQKEAFEKLSSILTSNHFAQTNQQLLDENKNMLELQDDEDSDIEQDSLNDGDFL